MVLINLVKGAPIGLDPKELPYTATFLNCGKSFSYAIRNRDHLVRRFSELDKTVTCPDPEEIEVMIGNFPGVFEN